jgi:uncharacterized protein DUF1552
LRFVFVLHPNGWPFSEAQPKGLPRMESGPDRVSERPLKDLELPASLEPLAPFKDRLTIVQRLNGVHSHPYHGGAYGALSGSREARRSPLAESIDAALARAHPGVFPLVGLGIDPRSRDSESTQYVCSAWGPDQPAPTQVDPASAYRRLFGSVAGKDAQSDFQARGKLLDFLKDDVKQVRSRLVGDEKDRFDTYLHAFESMSDRLAKLKVMEPTLRRHAPKLDERYSSPNETQRLDAQFELAAGALISGLTNVVTICSGMCGVSGTYSGMGIDLSIHQIGHGGSDKGRPAAELMMIIRRGHAEFIAGLIRRLQAIPEGNGTMMDRTVIVFTSDAANAHHSDGRDWPFALIGNLGGRLKTGRHIEYPGYGRAGNRTINALYCTLLHAAGAPRDHFNLEGGLKEVDRPGPLPELLA